MSWTGWLLIISPIILALVLGYFIGLPWGVAPVIVVGWIEIGLATVLASMMGGASGSFGATAFAVLMWPAIWLGWI